MSLYHAVVHIDHHHAQILQFDGEHVHASKLKAHGPDTRQHAGGVRSEHEYFGQVCDELTGIREVLVTGSQTALSDFRHYVEKHRPPAVHIVGWESVNHPSENRLLAFARQFFVKHNRMTGMTSA